MEPEEIQKQLQSKIDEFIARGCKLFILDSTSKKLLYSTVLEGIKIVNVYPVAEDRCEFDIGWQPAEFEPDITKGKSNYIINSPFYHHIVKANITEESIVFVDFWPDGTSRELIVKKVDNLLDEKKLKSWHEFKISHPEKLSDIQVNLLDVPWGKLVNHKGCPVEQ